MDLTPKHEKRINDLIKASGTAVVLVIVSFLGPIGLIVMLVAFLYRFECGSLLRRYPNLPPDLAEGLARARKRFLVVALIPLIVWTLFAALIAIVILTSPPANADTLGLF